MRRGPTYLSLSGLGVITLAPVSWCRYPMPKDAIRLEPAAGMPVPVVYDSPHSGRTYPLDFEHAVDLMTLRQAEDTHVEALFAHVTTHGSPLLSALFPRTYIDVNRALEDFDVGLVSGEWQLPVAPTEFCRKGIGLVWRDVGIEGPIYAHPLAPEAVLKRIYFCWRPYHEMLARLLDDAHKRFGRVYHINCHSMPSPGLLQETDTPGAHADFVLGDRDGTTCAPAFLAHVRAMLEGMGYRVAVNDPYKGVELLRRYADPAGGRHGLQIEIARRLYMDEATRNRTGGFHKLRADLETLTAAIAAYAVEQG